MARRSDSTPKRHALRQTGTLNPRPARLFGFSRPSFYHARGAFTRGGLGALVPQKRGPRRAHKLSQKVVAFLERTIAADPGADLVAAVQQEFGISVHRRSIERALA